LDKQGELGSIAPGKAADLVAMRCNPIEKIECTAEVQWVVKDGEIIRGSSNQD
jgi:imidazolonepropionase-like amidohydrolase